MSTVPRQDDASSVDRWRIRVTSAAPPHRSRGSETTLQRRTLRARSCAGRKPARTPSLGAGRWRRREATELKTFVRAAHDHLVQFGGLHSPWAGGAAQIVAVLSHQPADVTNPHRPAASNPCAAAAVRLRRGRFPRVVRVGRQHERPHRREQHACAARGRRACKGISRVCEEASCRQIISASSFFFPVSDKPTEAPRSSRRPTHAAIPDVRCQQHEERTDDFPRPRADPIDGSRQHRNERDGDTRKERRLAR